MQEAVYSKQSLGVVGEWVNNALRSEVGYVLRGSDAVEAVSATGTITITTNPTAGDTVTVAGVSYTCVADDAVGTQFELGTTTTITATNLAGAIGGLVTATSATNVVTVTSTIAGVYGNGIGLATSTSNITLSGANLTGGTDYVAGSGATVGRAFSFGETTDEAKQGLTAVADFAGIFVNPKNQAIYNGLTPTLTVPDGTVGALAKSGNIFVIMTTDCEAGDSVYATSTGEITNTSVNSTQILGAKVISGASAGGLVYISLIPQVSVD